MSSRTIKLLHVEDEISQRRLFAHHLKVINDFHFEILYADAEGSARLDVSMPVEWSWSSSITTSVRATVCIAWRNCAVAIRSCRSSPSRGSPRDEIAAQLLQAGADDYILKQARPHQQCAGPCPTRRIGQGGCMAKAGCQISRIRPGAQRLREAVVHLLASYKRPVQTRPAIGRDHAPGRL